MLEPGSQACIRAAYRLYRGILDEVERADGDVFARRATVPPARRIAPRGREPRTSALSRHGEMASRLPGIAARPHR